MRIRIGDKEALYQPWIDVQRMISDKIKEIRNLRHLYQDPAERIGMMKVEKLLDNLASDYFEKAMNVLSTEVEL